MTRKFGEAARAVAAPGTDIFPCNHSMEPVSIEGHYDEAFSVLGLFEKIVYSSPV
jgi:allantoin racemase